MLKRYLQASNDHPTEQGIAIVYNGRDPNEVKVITQGQIPDIFR
jgi:hypothetical protein